MVAPLDPKVQVPLELRSSGMEFATLNEVLTVCTIQWASPKTRITYDFSSYVGPTKLDI